MVTIVVGTYLAVANFVAAFVCYDTRRWAPRDRIVSMCAIGFLWPLALLILILSSISGPKHYKIKNSIDISQE